MYNDECSGVGMRFQPLLRYLRSGWFILGAIRKAGISPSTGVSGTLADVAGNVRRGGLIPAYNQTLIQQYCPSPLIVIN